MFFRIDFLWHMPATHLIGALAAAAAGLTAVVWLTSRARMKRAAPPREEPRNETTFIEAAWAYHKAGCNESAIATFTDALGLNPNSVEALRGRSRCYSEIGEHDHAIRDVHAWVLCAPADGEAYLHRARIWKDLGFSDLAISDLRSSLRFSVSTAAARAAVDELARIAFDSSNDHAAAPEVKEDEVHSPLGSEEGTRFEAQHPTEEASDKVLTALPPPPPADSGHTPNDPAGARDAQAHLA